MGILVYTLMQDLADYYHHQIAPRGGLGHRLIAHELSVEMVRFLDYIGHTSETCPVYAKLREVWMSPYDAIDGDLRRLAARARPALARGLPPEMIGSPRP